MKLKYLLLASFCLLASCSQNMTAEKMIRQYIKKNPNGYVIKSGWYEIEEHHYHKNLFGRVSIKKRFFNIKLESDYNYDMSSNKYSPCCLYPEEMYYKEYYYVSSDNNPLDVRYTLENYRTQTTSFRNYCYYDPEESRSISYYKTASFCLEFELMGMRNIYPPAFYVTENTYWSYYDDNSLSYFCPIVPYFNGLKASRSYITEVYDLNDELDITNISINIRYNSYGIDGNIHLLELIDVSINKIDEPYLEVDVLGTISDNIPATAIIEIGDVCGGLNP